MNIKNCKVIYRCPKTWDALLETADPGIRYCTACDRGVHLCRDAKDLKHANERDWCVAILAKDDATTDKSGDADPMEKGRREFLGSISPDYLENR